MRELSASTQNNKQERERTKDIIDIAHADFPADVAAVFKKVTNREWLRESNIKAFNNPLTVNAANNVTDKNFIEWPKTHKTFLINKDGFDFRMLKFTFTQKRDKFLKAVTKFNNWLFVGYYAWYNGFYQTCRSHHVWVLTFHMYDAACDDVRGFICGDGSDAHIPASYKELLKHWGLLIFKALNGDGILPDAANALLYQSNIDEYELLKQLAQKFHPYMLTNIATILPTHPMQIEFRTYSAFQMTAIYYYLL